MELALMSEDCIQLKSGLKPAKPNAGLLRRSMIACWGWVPKGTLKALEGLQNSALRASAGPGDGEHAAHAGPREVF